jgi:hypothetical protein
MLKINHFHIIKYITKWCEDQDIKHRNNQKMTESQIKMIIMKKT